MGWVSDRHTGYHINDGMCCIYYGRQYKTQLNCRRSRGLNHSLCVTKCNCNITNTDLGICFAFTMKAHLVTVEAFLLHLFRGHQDLYYWFTKILYLAKFTGQLTFQRLHNKLDLLYYHELPFQRNFPRILP